MGHQAPAPDDCPLGQADQLRNLILFATCTALMYLAAPVGYVGVTQASLCRKLGASDGVANLPETAFLAMTFAPVIFAWLAPRAAQLRRNLILCYALASVSQATVAGLLVTQLSDNV